MIEKNCSIIQAIRQLYYNLARINVRYSHLVSFFLSLPITFKIYIYARQKIHLISIYEKKSISKSQKVIYQEYLK